MSGNKQRKAQALALGSYLIYKDAQPTQDNYIKNHFLRGQKDSPRDSASPSSSKVCCFAYKKKKKKKRKTVEDPGK